MPAVRHTPMDQNWFYSTLAQSSAAIVGLFGALLFNYLLNVAKKLATAKDELEESLRRWRSEFIDAINVAHIHAAELNPQERAAFEALSTQLKEFTGLKSSTELKVLLDSIAPHMANLSRKGSRVRSEFTGRNERILARFMRYDTRVLPQSILVLYCILTSMMITGVIMPITQLTGFDLVIFGVFTLTLLALFGWLGYELLFAHPSKMRARVR